MNKDNEVIENIIESEINYFKAKLQSLGLTEETTNRVITKSSIKVCIHCETPNSYSIHTNKDGSNMYECSNCKKTYFEMNQK
jgi:transposase-like protein